MKLRSALYTFAKLLGDMSAVKNNTVSKRVGRRIAGKVTGRLLGKWFR